MQFEYRKGNIVRCNGNEYLILLHGTDVIEEVTVEISDVRYDKGYSFIISQILMDVRRSTLYVLGDDINEYLLARREGSSILEP